ncbi:MULTISPECIES: hypothetical protein [unclassified Nonomuraea]|uniref:hypothetical protein n=1 Tax=unclassified Nonomuraea TaxID=2593643 RepID=UPI001377593B|nr:MULTISPECIES: hypothetical protein [unclassified Nonomuraea]NBE97553.1 hypothetical protein [Nonomuraea sp. K271]
MAAVRTATVTSTRIPWSPCGRCALLRAGLSTEAIRSVLPCARGERPDIEWCAELWDILNGELATMDRRIDDLQSGRDLLAGFLARP